MQCISKATRTALVLLILLTGFAANSPAAVNLPDSPPRYVVDMAGVVEDTVEQDLNGYLQELEQKTTAQMIVLTLTSLEGEDIRDFALTLAHDRWKLGQAGKDNGLLLLVAVNDRKYTIETGYGLEGMIPDSLAGEIGRRYLVPYFKKNDYSTGIYAGSLALANTIAQDAGVVISGMPRVSGGDARQKSSGPLGKIGTVLFLIFVLYMFIRHPRAFLTLLLLSSMGGGGRRGSWGGGGGGFGGFGGGGGGGFGGGGASGSW